MRFIICATLLTTAAVSSPLQAQTAPTKAAPAPAAPAQAAPAAAAAYTTEDTDVGTMLDDPASKAILVKYLPDLISSPQIDMARSMTLKAMQGYAPDKLSDETLAKIDADLAKLPVKK